MPRTTSAVVMYQPSSAAPARPLLTINGRPYSGLSYMTYIPDAKPIRQFSDAGCPLYFFSCTPDDCMYEIADIAWTAPDRWDYSQFDERLALFMEHAPDAYFIPRVYMTSPPWWDAAHVEELVVFDDGTRDKPGHIHTAKKTSYPSLASEAWRAATCDNLRRFIRHIEDGPFADRVAGYHLASQHTEEWFAFWVYQDYLGDYSAPAQRAWQRWLRARYETDAALRRAWGRDDVALDDAPMPSGDEHRAHYRADFRRAPAEQPSVDYALFFSDLMAETMETFAAAAKEAVERRKVIGAFYGYLLQFAEHAPISGHLALQRVFSCPDLDFFCSPSAYIHRELGAGYSFFMAPHESVTAHGKLWFNENDIHTYTYMANSDNWNLQGLHGINTLWDSIMMTRRELANSLCHGAAMWWFDFWARWYDDEDHMREVARGIALGEALCGKPLGSVAEILLVVDAESMAWQGWRSLLGPCISQLAVQLGHVGAPFDVIETGALERVLAPRHKLVILANLWCADEAKRARLRVLRGDARTLLWLHAPGAVGSWGDAMTDPAERARAMTGMALRVLEQPQRSPALTPRPALDKPATSFARRWREALERAPLVAPSTPDEISSEAKPAQLVCAPVAVDCAHGDVLAYTSDGAVGLAAVALDVATSVWCAAPLLTAPWLRALADAAGVHLYLDTGDAVYANSHLLAVAAVDQAGPRTLRFPRPVRAYDPFNERVLGDRVAELRLDMQAKEVIVMTVEA